MGKTSLIDSRQKRNKNANKALELAYFRSKKILSGKIFSSPAGANVKFIHFDRSARCVHGNLQAIVEHMVHRMSLLREFRVEFLLEFYYHFECHKNLLHPLLVPHFTIDNSICAKTSGVWQEALCFTLHEWNSLRFNPRRYPETRRVSAKWLR